MSDPAPAFEHLGSRHVGAVLSKCHGVVSRTGGGNGRDGKVDLRLCIHVVPLIHFDLVHVPHQEEDIVLGDLNDGEIGGRGREGEEGGVVGAVGEADRDRLGGVDAEGLGSNPLPQPHPPNQPLPHPQHPVHAGAVPTGQIPSNGQGLAGEGVQVRGVGVVGAVLGVGGQSGQHWQCMLRRRFSPFSARLTCRQ